MLDVATFSLSRELILANARLLERKLFDYFFAEGSRLDCIRALLAYQNDDGGFGNGIEPDLLCPDSTAIGAETALFVLDALKLVGSQIQADLTSWLNSSLTREGFVAHPPGTLQEYPHQAWWQDPDEQRVLAVAGIMYKLGEEKPRWGERVACFALKQSVPEQLNFYSYPLFLYALHCRDYPRREEVLAKYLALLPVLLSEHLDHHPLFSRYWYHAIPLLDKRLVDFQARQFVAVLGSDGGVKNPYETLPWWRPIFTLDGLILLRRYSYI